MTESGDSGADSETDGDYKTKIDKFEKNIPRLVSRRKKHNIVIGRPGPTAYSENISCLAENLKLSITDDIMNKIHTHRVMRAMGVACKQVASPTTVKKCVGRRRGKCSICPKTKDRKTDCKFCQCSEFVCKNRCINTI
jgi:hypothetical protein